MSQLPDDIILHIITCLPLKHAARCRILSKHFYNAISTPKFLRDHHALSSPSSSNPLIIHHSSPKFTAINSPSSPKSITLADEDMILLDSCNGILLLHVNHSATYYIFNPFTGGVLMFLDYVAESHHWWGLVVDINPSSSTSSPHISSDFKLVDLQTKTTLAYNCIRFRMFVPSDTTVLVMREVDWDYEGSFTPMIGRNWRPVYGHGCVHWLGVGATAIAAFDVETGQARFMRGPFREANIADCSDFQTWFGFVQGSLQLISIDYSKQISVHTHNYVTQEWRVVHKIRMPTDITGNGSVLPTFFDGLQKVFLHSREGGNNTEEIYVHDLSVGKWNKRGQVEVVDYGVDQRYVEFVPTTARVSNVYVSNMSAQPWSMKKGLCLLQRLLLDHS